MTTTHSHDANAGAPGGALPPGEMTPEDREAAIAAAFAADPILLPRHRKTPIRDWLTTMRDGTPGARAAARIAAVARSCQDPTAIISAEGRVEYASPGFAALVLRSEDDLTDVVFQSLVHPDDADACRTHFDQATAAAGQPVTAEWRVRRSDDSWVRTENRITDLLEDPDVTGVVLVTRDVTEQRRLDRERVQAAERRYQKLADPVTGLANRAHFRELLERAISRTGTEDAPVAVLIVGLDGVRPSSGGHWMAIGDELLRVAAERLVGAIGIDGGAEETVARLGGEEFGVLLEAMDAEHVVDVARHVLDFMGLPFAIGGDEIVVHASIGMAQAGAADNATEVLRQADIARYAAKSGGEYRYEAYREDLHDEVIGRFGLQADAGTVERKEILVHYQPIFDLHGGRVVGIEALMRWSHPQRGLVRPMEFVQGAEESGEIVTIGRNLLMTACTDARELQSQPGLEDMRVSVNLSARQLADPDLVADVRHALKTSGLFPDLLTLEMPEQAVENVTAELSATLTGLKALGVKLAIDDFGTGSLTLAFIHELPFEQLKIDRSLVAASADGTHESATLLHTVINAARSLNLETMAKGIETNNQLAQVRGAGCGLAQGFLLGKPMDFEHLQAFLRDRSHVVDGDSDSPMDSPVDSPVESPGVVSP